MHVGDGLGGSGESREREGKGRREAREMLEMTAPAQGRWHSEMERWGGGLAKNGNVLPVVLGDVRLGGGALDELSAHHIGQERRDLLAHLRHAATVGGPPGGK
jgi:hypothetical protein